MGLSKQWMTPCLKQTWIVSSVLSTMLGLGLGLGFTSGLLVALKAPDSDIKMSIEASSWLVSTSGIFCMAGFLITSITMDAYGRKISFALDIIPGIVASLVTYFATNFTHLVIGRAFYGIALGATSLLGTVVTGEYTSPEYRPMFLYLKTAFLYLGSTIAHLLGHFLHWRTVAIITSIPFFIALPIVYTWPESPSWLAENKKFKESEKSFFSFRERTEDSVKEIKELMHAQKDKKVMLTLTDKVMNLFKKVTKKNLWKPVIICMFAAVLLESSGRHTFPAYAAQIINEMTNDAPNSYLYNIMIDVIITISAMFSSYLVKKMRLRTLLFTTGSIAFIILMTACLCLFLSSRDILSKNYSWVSLLFFSLYFVFVNFGCAPVPLAVVGEIFPLEHRGIGISIVGYISAGLMFSNLKIMPLMMMHLKVYGAFAVSGVTLALALSVLYFILPETKNRTLQEIDDYFTYGQFKDDGNVVRDEDELTQDEIDNEKEFV